MRHLIKLYRKLLSMLPVEDLLDERSKCIEAYNKATSTTRNGRLLFLQCVREELVKRGSPQ